jgi:hypothetical protein
VQRWQWSVLACRSCRGSCSSRWPSATGGRGIPTTIDTANWNVSLALRTQNSKSRAGSVTHDQKNQTFSHRATFLSTHALHVSRCPVSYSIAYGQQECSKVIQAQTVFIDHHVSSSHPCRGHEMASPFKTRILQFKPPSLHPC